MRKSTQGFLIAIGIILVICFFAFVGIDTMLGGQLTQGEEIKMVQPSGFLPQRDQHYAEKVNVPNSEANLNNSQSHLYNAEATAIVNSSEAKIEQEKNNARTSSMFSSFVVMTLFCVLPLIGIIAALFLYMTDKDKKSGEIVKY